ncbi:hypothetical protein CL684_02925 [Candidatus Campbellbacteria bacterium]|nr:hypothetical protein [Candidatus Campbellbacteria bacterium]|tara:strand:- start:2926 stop:3300 length:375 start_codon:yes stop_codon:yes gene_type:complete
MKIFIIKPSNFKLIEGEVRKILKKDIQFLKKEKIYKRKNGRLPKISNVSGKKVCKLFIEAPLWKPDVFGITGKELDFQESDAGYSRLIYLPYGTKMIINGNDIHFIEFFDNSKLRMSYSLIALS